MYVYMCVCLRACDCVRMCAFACACVRANPQSIVRLPQLLSLLDNPGSHHLVTSTTRRQPEERALSENGLLDRALYKCFVIYLLYLLTSGTDRTQKHVDRKRVVILQKLKHAADRHFAPATRVLPRYPGILDKRRHEANVSHCTGWNMVLMSRIISDGDIAAAVLAFTRV